MKKYCSSLLLLAALAGCTTEPTTGAGATAPDCVVEDAGTGTRYLGITGRAPQVCAYKGIQFATAERFASAQLLAPHSGDYPAQKGGIQCLQKPGLDNENAQASLPAFGEEDCLYMNIFAPADAAGRDLPVMVFIHGGAFVLGSGAWDTYDGSTLAEEGDVIVASINYRLGPLGFWGSHQFGEPEAESGNQGLTDQIAALRWVQQYISAFGGDPAQVTIFGESAGAMSVCTLMATPAAEGLFARAIMQSGSCAAVSTLDEMAAHAATWATEAGCDSSGPTGMSCLRARDATQLIQDIHFDAVADALQPTIDGELLTDTPYAMIKERGHNVPLLAGSTANEVQVISVLLAPLQQLRSMPWSTYLGHIDDYYPADVARIIRRYYGSAQYATPFDAYNDFQTDWLLTCPTWLAAELADSLDAPSYHYRFAWKPEGEIGEQIGTHHALELFFVFDRLDTYALLYEMSDEHAAQQLGQQIRAAWLGFARSGVPVLPDGSDWPVLSAGGSVVMDRSWSVDADLKRAECTALAPYLPQGLHKSSAALMDFWRELE